MNARLSIIRRALWMLLAGAMLLGVPAPRAARADTYGEVVITYEPAAKAQSRHGYVEHRFRVTNRSKRDSHRVTLAFESYGGGSEARIESLRRTTEVGPSSSVLVTLPQPPLPLVMSNRANVLIDGRRKDPLGVRTDHHGISRYGHYSGGYRSSEKLVLVSRNVSGNMRSSIESSLGGSATVARADHPVSDWSANWLAYSRFDGVVVTAEEMKRMPSAARDALWRSIEAGGTLLVVGDWTIPEPWSRRTASYGSLLNAQVGFGQCLVVTSAARGRLDGQALNEFTRSVSRTATPFASNRNIDEANRQFSIVKELRIPVRGLFLLMLLFAVVIGPANLIVLSRKKRRIWMLWTIPAISLVASGAVFGYALLAEGWTGQRRMQVTTILDEVSHRATTIGWTAYYSPMTPGGGLHFSYETELTPQVGTDYQNDGRGRSVDWTGDQHLSSGWVTSRVPAHFMLRKSELRRERLSVQKQTGGSPAVVNGLGADITQLWLADEKGAIHYGENIGVGTRATLQPNRGAAHALGKSDGLQKSYGGTWLREPLAMTRQPHVYLRPNTYIAVLDDVPFVEPGMEDANPLELTNIVYGIMGEGDRAD